MSEKPHLCSNLLSSCITESTESRAMILVFDELIVKYGQKKNETWRPNEQKHTFNWFGLFRNPYT